MARALPSQRGKQTGSPSCYDWNISAETHCMNFLKEGRWELKFGILYLPPEGPFSRGLPLTKTVVGGAGAEYASSSPLG